jgi:hypothetical protein
VVPDLPAVPEVLLAPLPDIVLPAYSPARSACELAGVLVAPVHGHGRAAPGEFGGGSRPDAP